MYKTMQALITDVEKALYQSAGPSVQLYSQDIIMQHLQDAFDHIFTKRWWPQFRKRETLTLDGVTGYTTTLPVYIKLYEDIRYVYPDTGSRPLSKLPLGINTLSNGFNNGSTARWVEGDAANIFRVWPAGSVGQVSVVGRARPDPFIITDTVPIDATLMRHFAAWSYFVDDSSNPDAAEKHRNLFETRLQQFESDSFNEPIMLDQNSTRVPTEWNEAPY